VITSASLVSLRKRSDPRPFHRGTAARRAFQPNTVRVRAATKHWRNVSIKLYSYIILLTNNFFCSVHEKRNEYYFYFINTSCSILQLTCTTYVNEVQTKTRLNNIILSNIMYGKIRSSVWTL